MESVTVSMVVSVIDSATQHHRKGNMPTKNESTSGRTFERVGPTFHKFEAEGEMIEGEYKGSRTIYLSGDPVSRHSLQTEDGLITFLGSAWLDGELEAVEFGDVIQVVFTGLTDKLYEGGNAAKTYEVRRAV